jgi:hypothetical protein
MPKPIMEFSAKPEHLNIIKQAQPLINSNIPDNQIIGPEISATHPVYTIGVDELKKRASKKALGAVTSLRMLETNKSKKIASAYEVHPTKKTSAVNSVHTDVSYLTRLNTGLETATKVAQKERSTAALRMINVPALYTEAYWLHYGEETEKDMVVPVHSFIFKENIPVPYEEFIGKLREAAKAVPDVSKDELLGG